MAPLSVGCAFGAANARIGYFPPPRQDFIPGMDARVQPKLVDLTYGMAAGRASIGVTRRGQWVSGLQAWNEGFQPDNEPLFLHSPAPFLAAPRHLRPVAPLPEGITPTAPAFVAALLPQLIQKIHGESRDFSVTSLTFTAPLPALPTWRAALKNACIALNDARNAFDITLQDVITETEAILAAYQFVRQRAHGPFAPGEHLVICDWGAEAVQLALVRADVATEKTAPFELLAYQCLSGIGGQSVDRLLWSHLRRLSLDRGPERTITLGGTPMRQTLEEIEDAKIILCNAAADDSAVFLEHLSDFSRQDVNLPYRDLAQILQAHLATPFTEACARLHHAAGAPPVAHLLLAGGGSALPICGAILEQTFPTATALSSHDLNPDEAAVTGAILRAAQLHHRPEAGPVVTLSVPPLLPYDIAIAGGPPRDRRFLPLIPTYTPITATMAGERTVRVHGSRELSLTIVCHLPDDPYRHLPPHVTPLATVNLGDLPADTPVSVRVTGAPGAFFLSVQWPSGRIGPMPLAPLNDDGLLGGRS